MQPMARLIAIGVVAGVFSAVFGVGGGIVIVPLLITFAAFIPHRAAATSIAAILLTSLAGMTLYALRGEVRPAYALLVGLPAVAGAILGTRIQHRISGQALTLAFAVLIAVIGCWLVLG